MRVGGDVGVSILPEGPYTATAGSNLVFTCIGGYNRSDSHYYKMRNGPFYLAIKSRPPLDYIGYDRNIYNCLISQVVRA